MIQIEIFILKLIAIDGVATESITSFKVSTLICRINQLFGLFFKEVPEA